MITISVVVVVMVIMMCRIYDGLCPLTDVMNVIAKVMNTR